MICKYCLKSFEKGICDACDECDARMTRFHTLVNRFMGFQAPHTRIPCLGRERPEPKKEEVFIQVRKPRKKVPKVYKGKDAA